MTDGLLVLQALRSEGIASLESVGSIALEANGNLPVLMKSGGTGSIADAAGTRRSGSREKSCAREKGSGSGCIPVYGAVFWLFTGLNCLGL